MAGQRHVEQVALDVPFEKRRLVALEGRDRKTGRSTPYLGSFEGGTRGIDKYKRLSEGESDMDRSVAA